MPQLLDNVKEAAAVLATSLASSGPDARPAAAKPAAEALCLKALELASEVALVASEVAPAASEVALAPNPTPNPAAALDSEPSCSVVTSSAADPITYSAAASKPAGGPKRSAPASQPAVVLTPLEVNICACTHLQCSAHHICDAQCTLYLRCSCNVVHITSLMCSARYISDAVHINAVHIISVMQCTTPLLHTSLLHTSAHIYNAMTSVIELHRYTNCSWQFATNNVYCADQEVDDFAVAQSTPLPECIAGFEGDTVRRLSHSRPTFIRHRFMLSQSPPMAISSVSPRPSLSYRVATPTLRVLASRSSSRRTSATSPSRPRRRRRS
jgi:hypothetical protein